MLLRVAVMIGLYASSRNALVIALTEYDVRTPKGGVYINGLKINWKCNPWMEYQSEIYCIFRVPIRIDTPVLSAK